MRPTPRHPRRPARLALTGALFVVAVGGTALAGAPSGATARCQDGTYSYSQHHSGTCSRHGGVAAWLGSTSPTPRTTPSPTPHTVKAGRTVLLARRTRTSGCRLGANPDRRCSPGAYYTGLTRTVICAPGFRTSKIRNVSDATKHAIEAAYGLTPRSYGNTLEIDHIIPLELGGSNHPANLFPEPATAHPPYWVKDRLENRLHQLVCQGTMNLRAAQHQIATNWQALYHRVYHTNPAN